jgi:uncharacterized protein YktA (UPF0223 family)
MNRPITTSWSQIDCTTVVDNIRELENVYGNDGSERELDDVCARKTNGRVVPMTKSGEIVTSRSIASIRRD